MVPCSKTWSGSPAARTGPGEITPPSADALPSSGEILQPGDTITLEGDTQLIALWQPAEGTSAETPDAAGAEGSVEEEIGQDGDAEAQGEPETEGEGEAAPAPEDGPAATEEPETEVTQLAEEPVREPAPEGEPATTEEPEPEATQPAEEPASDSAPDVPQQGDAAQAVENEEAPARKCTITFDGGGADGEMTAVQIAAGSEYRLPDCGYHVDGATFDAWLVSGVDGDEPVTYHAGDVIIPESDLIVMASWLFDEGGDTESGIDTLVYGEDEVDEGSAGDEDVIIEYDVEEAAEDTVVELEEGPSEAGSVFSSAGMAAIIAAATLVIGAAGIAASRKKKK